MAFQGHRKGTLSSASLSRYFLALLSSPDHLLLSLMSCHVTLMAVQDKVLQYLSNDLVTSPVLINQKAHWQSEEKTLFALDGKVLNISRHAVANAVVLCEYIPVKMEGSYYKRILLLSMDLSELGSCYLVSPDLTSADFLFNFLLMRHLFSLVLIKERKTYLAHCMRCFQWFQIA